MKKLLVAMALLGVLTCKAVQFAPRIHSDLKNVTLNSSLQAGQNRNLLVGQVSQTSTRPRCKNVCSKFEVTAFSVPASTCPNGGAIAVGITGGTPPFTYTSGGNIIREDSLFTTIFKGLSNNTYAFEVTDSKGCSSQQTVTVNNICPAASCNFKLFAQVVPESICPNNQRPGRIAIGISGATGPIDISFSDDGGSTFGPVQTIPLTSLPTLFGPASNGNYVVKVKDAGGSPTCLELTQAVTVANICPVIPPCALPFLYCCK